MTNKASSTPNPWYELGMATCHLAAGSIMRQVQQLQTSVTTRLLVSDGGISFPACHADDLRRAALDFIRETGRFHGLQAALVSDPKAPEHMHVLLVREPVAAHIIRHVGNDNTPQRGDR